MNTYIACFVGFVFFSSVCFIEKLDAEEIEAPPLGVIDPSIAKVGYAGREILDYNVSWTGGIKIGELHLEISSLENESDGFEIRADICTRGGAIHYLYPINDQHITRVNGEKKLPYYYEVWQDEGYRYNAHRVTEYDQKRFVVRSRKNQNQVHEYRLNGEVNNEFSSFFNSRLMDFAIGSPFIVPTFADKKRVEVVVHPKGRKEFKDTILGKVSTVEIMPVMKFKGLYDKKGDTVIYYTDDTCRVPIEIRSKIAIGSLTAKLVGYENKNCNLYPVVHRK